MRPLLTLTFLIISLSFFTQCPDCEPDLSCIGDNGPISCPETLPDATANVYYEEVISFYMPNTFTDAETGFEVTLNQVIITSVNGTPYGLESTFNSDDLTYYPGEGEEHGCVTLCGTPLLSGAYQGYITIHAFASVLGIDIEVDEIFNLSLLVLEGEGANNSFSYDQITGCNDLSAIFEGSIDGSPQQTTWDWDFGNGNTSSEQYPPTQFFGEPGTYTVSLTTQISNFVLTEVVLDDLSGGWAGDVEELIEAFSDPDPYFTITNGDGNGVYTSSSMDNTTSGSWTDLNIILSNPPYSISFYDEDNVSADDFLGTYNIESEEGGQNYNVNSGTEGDLTIDLVIETEFYNEEIVQVFDTPDATYIVDGENDALFFDNPDLVNFIWYYFDEPIADENDSILSMNDWGVYYCTVYSEFGCTADSEEYIYCPDFTPTFNENSNVVSAPEGFVSYQWFMNGVEIEGETDSSIEIESYGNYSVIITTDYGCEVESETFSYVSVIEQLSDDSFEIFPNPNRGIFSVKLPKNSSHIRQLNVYDLSGKKVYSIDGMSETTFTLNLKDLLQKGVYIIQLEGDENFHTKRLVIQ